MSLRLIPAPAESETLAQHTRTLLSALTALHERLVDLAQLALAKIGAMRAADVATLDSLAAREAAALESLQACDAQRRAILAGFAQHLPQLTRQAPRLGELADCLPAPLALQIRAKNEGLRSAARTLEEKNQLVAFVARSLHSHVRGVFADLARANQESVVYGRTGQHDQRVARSWVDAVG